MRVAVEAGATALGFVLAPSKRQISLSRARELARLSEDRLTVAVLVNPEPREIEAALEVCQIVQLHGQEAPELCERYRERIWKAIPGSEHARASRYAAAAFLVDGSNPGSGQAFDWSALEGWVCPAPLWLAGGLHPGNVREAIRRVRPHGVDVSSGVEESPGRKDPGLIRAFCQAALSASSRGPLPAPSRRPPPGAFP